jgi:hypothetical protein
MKISRRAFAARAARRACGLAGLAVISFGAIAALGAVQPAEACTRWTNQLVTCDVLDITTCNVPTPGQEAYYMRRVWRGTAQEACQSYWRIFRKKWGTWWDGQGPRTNTCGVAVPTSNPIVQNCHPDYNCNGIADAHDTWYDNAPVGKEVNVQRDSCCDRVPKGPYTQLKLDHPDWFAFTPQAGKPFSFETKILVIDENRARTAASGMGTINDVISDSFGLGGATPADPYQLLTWTSSYYVHQTYANWDFYNDPDYALPLNTGMEYTPNRLSVDHIIPRIDSHGCACGSDDVDNAQVISAFANSSMQNSCNDPRRIAILNQYTDPAP